MDGGRSDGGGGQVEMEDEFTCARMLRGSLTSLHDAVERIFSVTFWIGADDLSHDSNGQIWLKLQGVPKNVKAAKLFVKGVVNQEEQQEMSYPAALHCVFCGAKGLFMDCLIKTTSAHIMVGSPGFLLISGLAEPVVRAYSLITDLLERYEGTQVTNLETSDRGLDESLDSRRAFKTLVEKWEDKHILDLLVLPGSVKEVLLDLVKESGSNQTLAEGHVGLGLQGASQVLSPEENSSVTGAGAGGKNVLPGTRGRAEGAEGGQTRSPQEVGEEEQVGAVASGGLEGGDERESSMGNKEFDLLLKFFTAMGYTEDVVKTVLVQTGPQEASQILDLVQQEQDCSDRERGHRPGLTLGQVERNRPCETEHRHDEEGAGATGGDEDVRRNGERAGATRPEREGVRGETEGGRDDDFVLGVLKKAAVSCGYEERKVAEVYNMLPGRSTHQLLLELQREESRDTDHHRAGPRETDDLPLVREAQKAGPKEDQTRNAQLFGPTDKRDAHDDVPPLLVPAWYPRNPPPNRHNAHPKQHPARKPQTLSEVKGPPVPSFLSSPDPPFADFQPNKTYGPKPAPNSKCPTSAKLKASEPHVFTAPSPSRVRERQGFVSPSSVVVTGEQRFLEGLQTPFDLQLTDKPGNPMLRMIIIDGSNVAMSHGLGHFFSCRGIALAVQHFWDRGHRHISALLPQWRQKSDPKIKEQHYLSQLQELGLVSYTPSREFLGKRISSYDDRIMLQLAQSSRDGVIVTNDNLRDLMDESPVWRDIIKKRLLQYTFVGDHFMVPDDPLGRGGPHLDDFLRSEHRTPDPGNHSFAGVATIYPSSKTPRSQTELLNLRDRTPGGAVDGGGGRGKGRWHGKGWDTQRRNHGAEAFGAADRTAEETDGLKEQLLLVFPGQDNMVTLMLQWHPTETDINVLSDLLLRALKD